MTNCKNCGAPLVGERCEYCGTRYDVPETKTSGCSDFDFELPRRDIYLDMVTDIFGRQYNLKGRTI